MTYLGHVRHAVVRAVVWVSEGPADISGGGDRFAADPRQFGSLAAGFNEHGANANNGPVARPMRSTSAYRAREWVAT